ncbi:MAG: hypothetical protein GY707_14050, partial [Desulfobacteraceae bacterium]|nr:hypothetical protein [Desulfobacteraceae bacterium]
FESQPLSVSSVWAVGTLCAKAVSETGWPMKFTRYTEYTVDDLPMFNLDEKNAASSQALFSDERIIQLAEAGITPVVGAKNKDFVFIPKETSLACESIKFQMFFNRILESIINMQAQKELSLPPQEAIKKAIADIFIQTGHDKPENISVVREASDSQDQEIFLISFIPPASVIAGSNIVEFTFVW